jgi:hypothetical protein
MSFDWNKAADEAGNAKLDEGYYPVQVTKCIRVKKDGSEMKTKNGDPMLFAVYERTDGDGECGRSYTLTDSAIGWLAQAFKTWDEATTTAWGKQGVTLNDFTDEKRAAELLVGKSGWVHVTTKGKYLNVEHVSRADVPADRLQAAKPVLSGVSGGSVEPVDDSEIPF